MVSEPPFSFRRALPWTAFVAVLFWLNYSARALLSPLLVSVETDLRVGHAAATSLLLMQSLGFSVAQLSCGFLLSRIRPAHMAGLSIAASGLVLCGMPLVSSLAEGRMAFMLFGFMAGFYFPAAMATLSSLVYPQDWGKAVSVHELAPNIGFIFIPLLAQAGLLIAPWQGVFAMLGGLMALVGAGFLRFGKGGRTYSAPPSFRGVSAMVADPAVWAIIGLLAIATIGEFSVFSILQIYLVNAVNFAPDTANVIIALARVLTPAAVVLGGWAADRCNVYHVVGIGLAVHAAALGMMCVPGVRAVALLGVGLQASSIAVLFPSIFKAMAQAFPAGRQPVLMSLSMPLASVISAGLVPVFLGWCGEYLTFGVGLACVAAASLASLGAVGYLARRHARSGESIL